MCLASRTILPRGALLVQRRPPGTGSAAYRKGGAGPIARRRPQAVWGEPLLPNSILEGLARVERREPRCRDLDALAGLWIAAFARLTLAGLERPESGDLDLLAGHERGSDQSFLAGREEGVDDRARLTRGESGSLDDGRDELGLVHDVTSFRKGRASPYVRPQGVSNGFRMRTRVFGDSIQLLRAPEAAEAARPLLVVDLREILDVDLEVVLVTDVPGDAARELHLPAVELPLHVERLGDHAAGLRVELPAVLQVPVLREIERARAANRDARVPRRVASGRERVA